MKCPNCGAEIGTSKFCQYCGTQISIEMQKEQEQLNKLGCPKCGSTNIQFKRENQGEVRGKNSKQVIHRTVGFCKDCGATWYPNSVANELPKRRKTWLWVLGWIFIFPVPLTILMLRNKRMKPALKYGIIAAAWIIYLLIALGSNNSQGEEPKTEQQSKPNEVLAEEQQHLSSESNDEELSNKTLDVTLEVKPTVNSEDGTVLFEVKTNLPEDTKMMVTVYNDSYTAQDNIIILEDGAGYTSEFSNKGEGLKGTYIVDVTMTIPSLQEESVREIIGQKGEKLAGKYVTTSSIGDSNTVEGEFEFTFD